MRLPIATAVGHNADNHSHSAGEGSSTRWSRRSRPSPLGCRAPFASRLRTRSGTVRTAVRPSLRGEGGSVTRSEEHTSELQSLMRISYAVFCLNKKTNYNIQHREYLNYPDQSHIVLNN